jgi:hypothetical protein
VFSDNKNRRVTTPTWQFSAMELHVELFELTSMMVEPYLPCIVQHLCTLKAVEHDDKKPSTCERFEAPSWDTCAIACSDEALPELMSLGS